MRHQWYQLLFLFTALRNYCCARLSEQIYLDLIGGRYSCFRLLNGTHEIGCGSAKEGNEGVVLYADSADNLVKFITNRVFSGGIVVAFDISLLNENTINALKDDQVHGVLLFHNGSLVEKEAKVNKGFSEDASCPNQQFGLYESCEIKWNERGALLPEGFRFTNWNKPIFVIENETEINIIKHNCYETFNSKSFKSGVLCSAHMKHFMWAAGNAEICLRRQKLFYSFSDTSISLCDSLEDKNLFATVPAFVKNFSPKMLILSARMDSFSSFTEAAVGEVSVLTSIVSLLAVAKALGSSLKEFETLAYYRRRAVVFAFFHGESLGYIGSSATINDIKKGDFPFGLHLEDIDGFIEVQQLDGLEERLSAHIDPESYYSPGNKLKVETLLDAATSAYKRSYSENGGTGREDIINEKGRTQVPPSSYQSFLKKRRDIAGFVLRPFGQQYTYNRINSLEDQNVFRNDTTKLKKQIIAAASAILGAVIRFVAGGNETEIGLLKKYKVDKNYVDVLLDCFLTYSNWQTCEFFKSITKGDDRFEFLSRETYISAGKNHYSLIRILVNALIVNALGSKSAINVSNRDQCEDLNIHQKIYYYMWQYDPEAARFFCYRNSLYTTTAESPAFTISNYDMRSGMYSTWVESVWSTKELKLFLTVHPSPMHDVTVLLAGVIFFIISYFIMEVIYMGNQEAIESSTTLFDFEDDDDDDLL